MPDYAFVFEDRVRDIDAGLRVEGRLPGELKGDFLTIGSTGTRAGSTPLHALDGDGRVTRVRVGGGEARMLSRLVATPLRSADQAAGAMTKRRLFTNKPGRWSNFLDLDIGNNAFHNVVRWGDHVVAANDPGYFLLDPDTLETRGPAPIGPKKGSTLGPMPRRDPRTGRWVVFEVSHGIRDRVVVREHADDFSVASERSFKLATGGVMLHDIAFTPNWYVVLQWSVLSLPRLLWGARPVVESFRFDPATSPTLHLLPRSGGPAVAVPMPGGRQHAHMWNAFEEDGRVVVDAIGYEGEVTFRSLYPPQVREGLGISGPQVTPAALTYRYVADPATATMTSRLLSDVQGEPPEIHPDRRGVRQRFGWTASPGQAGDEEDHGFYYWYHGLARYDFDSGATQTWDAGPRVSVGAPAMAPRPGGGAEDDGWVLAWLQDLANRTSSVGIFDARDIAAGPVARLCAPADAGLIGLVSHVAFS